MKGSPLFYYSLFISLPPSPLSYISSPTLSCLAGLRWPFPSISYLPPRLWPCRGLPVFSRYSGAVLSCAFTVGDDVGDNLLFPLLQHRGRSWEKCDMRAAGTKKRGIVVDASFRVGRKNYCEMMLRNSFVAAWLGSTLKILLHHSIVLVNLNVFLCSSVMARYLSYSATYSKLAM